MNILSKIKNVQSYNNQCKETCIVFIHGTVAEGSKVTHSEFKFRESTELKYQSSHDFNT